MFLLKTFFFLSGSSCFADRLNRLRLTLLESDWNGEEKHEERVKGSSPVCWKIQGAVFYYFPSLYSRNEAHTKDTPSSYNEQYTGGSGGVPVVGRRAVAPMALSNSIICLSQSDLLADHYESNYAEGQHRVKSC